ncbi:hypothetical protein Ato02nite_064710 [Paractinoplanes toevensis]|uniref:Uncharacterized protein n=1 Tax=Paractinoplanes toevensis TaxID=571911 RepID=A0A919TFX1_9ACTN|nr:hypothetical protein Ato02nite_064710 [Actinoplanes toevensis]
MPEQAGADDEADLFAKFASGRFLERFASIHTTARGHPPMSPSAVRRIEEELQQENPLVAVEKDHSCGAAAV